jgi:hypothetical protein
MNVLEVTYSQLGRIVFKKQETTKHPITELGARYWLLNNLWRILILRKHEYQFDDRKHIDIHLLVTQDGKNPSKEYFFCRPTTSEKECHLKMPDGKMYLIQNSSQFSVTCDFNHQKTFDAIEYQSLPKYDSKGPIRPHPFRN